jgi:beta-galactosidase beta subunit
MIIGRLDSQCISLRILLQQRTAWRSCFDWLRNMPQDLPFGRYKIDHEIVTAFYMCCFDGGINECLQTSDSIVQIQYVVDGFEEIELLLTKDSTINQCERRENQHTSVKDLLIKLKAGEFIVIFPGELENMRVGVISECGVKKVVVSMPVQRIFL